MKIDMLMPAGGNGYAGLAGEQFGIYREHFAAAGATLSPRAWSDGAGEANATLALLAWGYHADVARWDAIVAAWPADRLLLNAQPILQWNTRKTYLAELEAAGVPIVPTIFADCADQDALAAAFTRFETGEIVVKPQISAGSDRTERVRRGERIAPIADAMLQPFLPAVADEGELSLFYVGGALTHAIRKVATGGDFRVQPQFGGINTRWVADAEARGVAEAAIAACPAQPLYARIDLVRLDDGQLALMEFEAIEPDLYLDHSDDAAARLVEAVLIAIQ